MNKIYLVATIGPDFRLLPKFIKYYKNLGVTDFLILLNTSDQTPLSILKYFDITPEKIWVEKFSETLKQKYEREIVEKNCTDHDWVVYADLDEFQYYPMGFMNYITLCEIKGVDFLEGRLVDRLSESGELIDLDESKSLEEQFPLRGYITNNLLKAWDKKIVCAKGNLVVGGGHHIFLDRTTYKTLPYDTDLNEYSQSIEIHHFKWDTRALSRMSNYLLLPDDSLAAWRAEISRFLSHYSKHNRIDISDKKFKIEKNKHSINI